MNRLGLLVLLVSLVTIGIEASAQTPGPHVLEIESTDRTFQGQHEFVDVLYRDGGSPFGGFDLLIKYDASALSLRNAMPGNALFAGGCGWEYFTYRNNPIGNCSNCATGFVRIVGIAETNNGANHPDCFTIDPGEAMFTLDFLVTDDRTFECQFVPINFVWYDCGDNTLSNVAGDTLLISRHVYQNTWSGRIDDTSHTNYPSFFGAGSNCINEEPGKPSPIRFIDFYNGGVEIVCADSIDDRGDINLNGQANEIADAVMYSNYFVLGLGVFKLSPAGQIAASDVNADGLTLSVADLVRLIRIVVGDADAIPKLAPIAVGYCFDDGALTVDQTLGAAHVIVGGRVEPELEAHGMELKYQYHAEADETRILVYSIERDRAFNGKFLSGLGGELRLVEFATYQGMPVAAKELPSGFELAQNYPNPFNPTTTISFSLAAESDYTLTIVNIQGQVVEEFRGTAATAGPVEIEWDASGVASGVYLYRLDAGSYSASRKMMLLK